MEGKKETEEGNKFSFFFVPHSLFLIAPFLYLSTIYRMGILVGNILKENLQYTMEKKV